MTVILQRINVSLSLLYLSKGLGTLQTKMALENMRKEAVQKGDR
jgi:hypothetical protein